MLLKNNLVEKAAPLPQKTRQPDSVDWSTLLSLTKLSDYSSDISAAEYDQAVSALLNDMYDLDHPPDGRHAKQALRYMSSSCGVDFEVFLSGMQRQQYEEFARQYRESGETWNRLSFSQKSLVFKDQLAIAPDGIPFFRHHSLLRPVIPGQIDSSFKSFGLADLKFGEVTKDQLDLRPEFTFEDIVTMATLVQRVPSYMISQSMGGSGASIPEAIHGHAFPVTASKFPLFSADCSVADSSCSGLWAIDRISFGIVVEGGPEDIAQVFIDLRDEFQLDSNHYIQVRRDYGGLAGLYLPRTARLPKVERLAEADWKFGAFEVLALFDSKNREIYETLTAEEAEEAIHSVTVQDPKLQRDFVKKASDTLQRLRR